MQVKLTQSQWRYLALSEIALVAMCLAYWSFQTPFPYGDGLRTFDYAVRNSWSDVWMGLFSGTEEFRPLYFAAVKLVHDLSGGPSMLPFRAIQMIFVVVDLALLYLLFRPHSASAWFGLTLAVTCFVGLHTTTDNLTTSTPLPFGPVVFALVVPGGVSVHRRPEDVRLCDAPVVVSVSWPRPSSSSGPPRGIVSAPKLVELLHGRQVVGPPDRHLRSKAGVTDTGQDEQGDEEDAHCDAGDPEKHSSALSHG